VERGPRCPAATADADPVLQQLERIAAGELILGQTTLSSAAQIVVWRPFDDAGCPVLRDGVERREVMIRILRYAMDHDDERIAGPVMEYASATAYYGRNLIAGFVDGMRVPEAVARQVWKDGDTYDGPH
jgi:hypothetical protein